MQRHLDRGKHVRALESATMLDEAVRGFDINLTPYSLKVCSRLNLHSGRTRFPPERGVFPGGQQARFTRGHKKYKNVLVQGKIKWKKFKHTK